MDKIMVKLFIFSVVMLSVAENAYAKVILNTPNAISAPSVERKIFYALHAARGLLMQKNASEYKFILYQVHGVVSYSRAHDLQNNELINIVDFISEWQKMKEVNVEADVAGIQINNKAFGHTEFYATVLLKNPRYTGYVDEIAFTLIPLKPPIKMTNRHALVENVTIYINGCNFCNCNNISNGAINNCMKKIK